MNKHLKKLPLSISSFETIIENNYLYIDKTEYIYNLISPGQTYFLSRPRRFGKSLLISTMENLFLGKKELFKGLYIYDKWDWNKKHPVIHLDLSKTNSENINDFKQSLNFHLERIAEKFSIKLKAELYNDKLTELIEEIYSLYGEKVVVLVDEYDIPILNNLTNLSIVDEIRNNLSIFYNVLKSSGDYIEFIFITGVSKFAQTSIFSKLNNPIDITLSSEFSTICGISYNELEEYLSSYIENLAKENNKTYDECVGEINYWYDGYSWDGEKKVFNPQSTLTALSQPNKNFSDFWFETGTPTFLVDILKNRKINIDYFKPIDISQSELQSYDPLSIKDIPLLFQSGYLTIKKMHINGDGKINYTLGIPNFEVETGFRENLKDIYINKIENNFRTSQEEIWKELLNGKCEKLSKKLRMFITGIPYYLRLSKENHRFSNLPAVSKDNNEKWKFYSLIFTTWANEMDFQITEEKAIEDGRIDFILENLEKEQVIVVEMKYTEDQNKTLNTLLNEGFKQIEKKKYWYPYDTNTKLMVIALKDEYIDDGYITDIKCKIKAIPEEN